MNTNRFLAQTVFVSAVALVILALPNHLVHAQTNFVLQANDSPSQASFNNAANFRTGNVPGGAAVAPISGNTYETGTFRIRTENNNANYLFTGNSLTISSGGDWRNKTSGTATVNNLIVANNGVVELSQPNNTNGVSSVGTLAGNIALPSGTAIFMAGNSGDSPLHVFTISSTISGAGGLSTGNASRLLLGGSPPTAESNGIVILTGNNSFTGGLTSSGRAGSSLRLGNANAAKDSTVTVSVGTGSGLSFSSGIGTFNLGGLGGANNVILADTGSNAVTLNIGGGVNNNSSTYTGILSGTGGITKSGTGTLTLSGANTYSGATSATAGALTLSGAGTFASGTVTSSGGTIDLGTKSITNILGALTGGGAINNGTITNNSGLYNVQSGSASAILAGSNGLIKTTGALVTLTGANTYTGATTVSAGTLTVSGAGSLASPTYTVDTGATLSLANAFAATSGTSVINGTISGGGVFTVGPSATLAGLGSIENSTIVNGILSPGNSPGVTTFSSGLALGSSSTFVWELTDNTSTGRGTIFDGIDVTGGTLNIDSSATSNLVFNSSGSTVDFSNSFWNMNQSWLVFDNASSPTVAGSIFGSINLIGAGSPAGTFAWGLLGDDVVLNYTAAAVPEPSAFALLAIAGIGGGLYRRFKSKRSATVPA